MTDCEARERREIRAAYAVAPQGVRRMLKRYSRRYPDWPRRYWIYRRILRWAAKENHVR